ncbi:MAG: hypothetical protein MI919_03280 [Holophagales bacterium]|nr:hypothetical protein [Holophagales bacterium]
MPTRPEPATVEEATMPAHAPSALADPPRFRRPIVFAALCLLAGIASDAGAEIDPRIRLRSLPADAALDFLKKSGPCVGHGIIPNVTGRCVSVKNSGEEPIAAPCESERPESLLGTGTESHIRSVSLDATCEAGAELALDLRTVDRAVTSDGSERLSVLPLGLTLLEVPTIHTACGIWRAEVVVDPSVLQPISRLRLRRDFPGALQGTSSGLLTVAVRARFQRADGAILEIPGAVEIDTTGSWELVTLAGGPWSEQLVIRPEWPGGGCWQPGCDGGLAVLVDTCAAAVCPDDGSPCPAWCEAGPMP